MSQSRFWAGGLWKDSPAGRVAVMMALTTLLTLLAAPLLLQGGEAAELLCPLLPGVSGAIGVRRFRTRWPEPLLGSIPLAAGVLLAAGAPLTPRGLIQAAAFASIGAFLLPLLDPMTPGEGADFPRWRSLAAAGVVATAVIIVVTLVTGGGAGMADLTLLWTKWAATVLCGAGLVVSAVLDRYVGAMIGASGALVWYVGWLIYLVLCFWSPCGGAAVV